jgi:antitoxin ParD1/3/4
MNVSLTEPLIEFIDQQIRSGRYRSASEVIRPGLRLLQDSPEGLPREPGQTAPERAAIGRVEHRIACAAGVNCSLGKGSLTHCAKPH